MEYTKVSEDCIYGLKLNVFQDFRGRSLELPEKVIPDINFHGVRTLIVNNLESMTLRGLHFQKKPMSEKKIVICLNGSVFDVIVNLDKNSKEYLKTYVFNLGVNFEFQGLLIPDNYAHGYLTLEPNTSLAYHFDKEYSEVHSDGIYWNSRLLNIPWPHTPKYISSKDSSFKDAEKLQY
jgi:dTDP-4-dehydrorhamnose 3,5-epimerase